MIILTNIGFNVKVNHPHAILACYLKQIAMGKDVNETSWAVLNDLYATRALVSYQPHILATAAVYIALKLVKEREENEELERFEWWKAFDVEIEDLLSINDAFLELRDKLSGIKQKLPLSTVDIEKYIQSK